jgi:hypothetical protein
VTAQLLKIDREPALFPIDALPTFLMWFARILPITHALAIMRYGLLGDSSGLHNIWGMSSATTMAALSSGSSPCSPRRSHSSPSGSSRVQLAIERRAAAKACTLSSHRSSSGPFIPVT